ncbi:MAG TPA: Os1348 family NHLP clan protein [Vicinamibacterales bacterium]
MAQRTVEMLIGRLITDEEFREEFLRQPERVLVALGDRGLELSAIEIAALVNTDHAIWARTADAIDQRLQKANLKPAGATSLA